MAVLVDRDVKDRRRAIVDYVRTRLQEECAGRRGKQAEVARETKFSSAHVANVVTRNRSIGDDFAHAMAAYWGMSFAELEIAALERARKAPRSPSSRPPPQTPALRHRAEWPVVLSTARDLHPEIDPEFWELAGDTVLPVSAPDRVDAIFVGTLASAYQRAARIGAAASNAPRN